MKTSIYIKLFALLAILAVATARDTKAPKATKSPKGTKSPKAGKAVTEEDFKNPDKIITVEAEPLLVWPVTPEWADEDEGPGRRLEHGDGEQIHGPEMLLGPEVWPVDNFLVNPCNGTDCRPIFRPPPKIASITEFGKKDFLAAIAEQKFPTEQKAAGLVCRCPPYAATFICIGFASCDGCCMRVSEIYNPRRGSKK